ncbi:MAG: DUF374 domain-containing protein [Myxococcales bacterium]|nr:DUF374 domain-containing protein [Myxococcales bacterium]
MSRAGLLAWLAAWLVRAWIATLRYRRSGPVIEGPGVVAFWHGDQLPLFGQRPAGPLVAPISLSRDGRLQARILARLGIADAPGSSSRGGTRAARALLRAVRRGAVALMAVDGPRGPRHEVKPGVVFLARLSGAPVWPVGVAVGRGRRLARAWDRYLLPLPFTRAWVVVGEPLRFAADADPEAARAALAAGLAEVGARAEQLRCR